MDSIPAAVLLPDEMTLYLSLAPTRRTLSDKPFSYATCHQPETPLATASNG